MKEKSSWSPIEVSSTGFSVCQNPSTSSAVLAWQNAKTKPPPSPSSKRRRPQPMYSTLFLENLAVLWAPFAEPEPSAVPGAQGPHQPAHHLFTARVVELRDVGLQLVHLRIRDRARRAINLDLLSNRLAPLLVRRGIARTGWSGCRRRIDRRARLVLHARQLLPDDCAQPLFVGRRCNGTGSSG